MNEITVFICPRCQQTAMRMPYSGDYEHKCGGNEVLANEDVLVIGDWTDYTNQGSEGPQELVVSLNNLRRSSSGRIVNGSVVSAQSFRTMTADPIQLGSLDLLLFRDNGIVNNSLGSEYLFVSLREDLLGADIDIGSVRAGLIGSTSSPIGNLRYTTFSLSGIQLDTSKDYFIVVSFPSGNLPATTGSRVLWMIPTTTSDLYTFGTAYQSTNGQLSWNTLIGSDTFFQVYGRRHDVTLQSNALKQGTENKLFGTRPDLEGDKETPNRTSRGFPTNRYRTRQHFENISEKNFKIESSKPDRQPEEYYGN